MNISVITINLNRRNDLGRTLESLRRQTDGNFQLVVVDGGSTDGSKELLRSYQSLIDAAICEPDKGIYDAWNKGINLADGDIIALLNAGDEYHPAVIAEIRRFYEPDWPRSGAVICTGKTYLVSHGKVRKFIGNSIRSSLLFGIGFAHPAMVVPRKIYDALGAYENISIASDSRFILRCKRAGVDFRAADFSVYMDASGISQRAAVKGFGQYVDALQDLGFCNWFMGLLLRAGYRTYRSLVDLGLVGRALSLLANFRHFGIWMLNVVQRMFFFRPLRGWFLRCLSLDVDSTSFVSPCVTLYRTGNLRVGGGSVINRGVVLDNRDQISIGAGCSLSYGVRIFTAGHDIDSPYFEYFSRPVVLEDYVCIFTGAMILPGATLRKGVVVLPGSVVSGDTVEGGVYGGMPARLIRMRASLPEHIFDYHRPFAF